MSMQLFVILASTHAPDAAAWNSSMISAHVPVTLSESADLSHLSGFLPVTVKGKGTGFYFLKESYAELAAHYSTVAKVKVDAPVVYSLGYGGDFHECAAAFYSASALVSKFGGTAFDPQGGVLMSQKDLLDAAKQCQEFADG